jgi:hypothetical protein
LSMDLANSTLAREISDVNAVSLHVRRGDYVHNSKAAATYALCSLDYYNKSIKYVAERVHNAHFFVFSDDIPWVKSNLEIDFPVKYIDNNFGVDSYNDMRLMSLCKHNIIANSSFSWWGAWLNLNSEKIVVSPMRWFFNETGIQDLIPKSWVRL